MKKTSYLRCLEKAVAYRTGMTKKAGLLEDVIAWTRANPTATGAIVGGLGVGAGAALAGGKHWLRNLILGGAFGAGGGAAGVYGWNELMKLLKANKKTPSPAAAPGKSRQEEMAGVAAAVNDDQIMRGPDALPKEDQAGMNAVMSGN